MWVGVRTPGTEVPERAERIRAELEAAGAPLHPVGSFHDDEALALHDPALVDWLRTAPEQWGLAGLEREPGQDRVVPYLFPQAALKDLAGAADGLDHHDRVR